MVVRPTTLPDEFVLGYVGRFMQMNAARTRNDAMALITGWTDANVGSQEAKSSVERLSRLAGMDVSTFVCMHTLLPFNRGIAHKYIDEPHGSPKYQSLLCMMALRRARPHAYFCQACLDEDVSFWGATYWRREHQLPGMFWCTKHGEPLYCTEDPGAFDVPPSAWSSRAEPFDPTWVKGLQNSPAVQRFLAIASELLSRSSPLDENTVSQVVYKRARVMGMHAGRGEPAQTLVSDQVKRNFDHLWIESVLPGLLEKPAGTFWHPVDGTARGRRNCSSPVAYTAVLSVLFDSADDALKAICTTARPRPKSPEQRSPRREVGADELRGAYIASDCSHLRTARSLALDDSVTSRALFELGLPGLGGARYRNLRSALLAFVEGQVSLVQACATHGVAVESLETVLRSCCGPATRALRAADSSGPKRPYLRRRTAKRIKRSDCRSELPPIQNVAQ